MGSRQWLRATKHENKGGFGEGWFEGFTTIVYLRDIIQVGSTFLLRLNPKGPAGPIDTQMFARAFVANKCASNGKCKHMQTHRLRGGALAVHTFWGIAPGLRKIAPE